MRRAFTLIEQLVVISVLAVLAALLFPVFAKARERAKQTQCVSNLKQINTAVRIYMQDWDDKYPWAWSIYYLDYQGKSPSLSQLIEPYVRSEEVWKCPSDIGETFLDGPQGYRQRTPPIYTMAEHSSYSYLGRGFGRTYGQVAGVPASRFPRPTETVMLLEPRPWHGNYRTNENVLESPALLNVLYCDGHVQQTTYKVAWRQIETAYRPWLPPED